MIRIVDIQGNGKTRKLLQYAKENKCVVLCSSPARMADKAVRYELGYVECMSYEEFLMLYKENDLPQRKYVVDEMERFVATIFTNGAIFDGYNLSIINI